MEQQKCTLGSGDLYITEFAYGMSIPEHNLIEIDENLIGSIAAGAEITYKPELKEVIDSKGVCLKRFITGAEVLFKTGIMTWNNEVLEMLSMGGTLEKTKEKSILKIGGRGAIKSYLIRFVHTMEDGLKYRATLVGTATNGFTLAFDGGEETVIDAEFKAMACDTEGNQLYLEEEYEVPTEQHVLKVGDDTIVSNDTIVGKKK